jgi:hypothetical protein
VVAEILQRYYPKEINIYKFYNGLRMAKRRDNWERIAKILNKNMMKPALTERDFEPVMFLAKGAAFGFVCRLYEFITQRDLKYKADLDEKPMPYHMKPTASLLMKNTELTRIVNADEKLRKNLEVLQTHYFSSKNDKSNLELDKFIIRQRQKILESNAKRLFSSSRRSKKAPEPAQSETKFIVLRGLEGNKKKNEKNAPIMESRGVVEYLNTLTYNALEKEENREIMKDLTLPKDHIFVNLMQNTYEYPPEFLQNLFEYLNHNIQEVVDGLANSYTDFKNFMGLMVQFLENIEPNTTLYAAFFTFTSNVGIQLVNEEPDSTCVFMESVGLEILTDFAKKFSNKKDALAHLVYFFTVHDSTTRYRVVKKLKEILSHEWRVFIPFLASLGIYPVTDNYDDKLFNFYWFYALLAIENSSPKIKAAGLKIINEISSVNTATVLSIVKKLKRLSSHTWWEIKTQILIICANLLMSLADDDELHDSQDVSRLDKADKFEKVDNSMSGNDDGEVKVADKDGIFIFLTRKIRGVRYSERRERSRQRRTDRTQEIPSGVSDLDNSRQLPSQRQRQRSKSRSDLLSHHSQAIPRPLPALPRRAPNNIGRDQGDSAKHRSLQRRGLSHCAIDNFFQVQADRRALRMELSRYCSGPKHLRQAAKARKVRNRTY